jgi:hypothetical protein
MTKFLTGISHNIIVVVVAIIIIIIIIVIMFVVAMGEGTNG